MIVKNYAKRILQKHAFPITHELKKKNPGQDALARIERKKERKNIMKGGNFKFNFSQL